MKAQIIVPRPQVANPGDSGDLPDYERPLSRPRRLVETAIWKFKELKKKMEEEQEAERKRRWEKMVVIELPENVFVMKSPTFNIIYINSRYLVEIDSIFHDNNGLPSNKRLEIYYKAVEKFYQGEG